MQEPQQKNNFIKIVLKFLPPLLTEEDFKKTLIKFAQIIVYAYYKKGKKKEKNIQFSKAYLVFRNQDDMKSFISNYNQIFIDDLGQQFKPIIEQTLFQYFPQSVKINDFENTYLESEEYHQFLEHYKQLQKVEAAQLSQIERKPGQILVEDKIKKIEKIRTPIIEDIEKYYENKKKKREQQQKKQQVIKPRILSKNSGNKNTVENQQQDKEQQQSHKQKYEKIDKSKGDNYNNNSKYDNDYGYYGNSKGNYYDDNSNYYEKNDKDYYNSITNNKKRDNNRYRKKNDQVQIMYVAKDSGQQNNND